MPDHEIDPPVPLDDLRRASTEALLERHVGVPLRQLSAELMVEVAQRVVAVLALADASIAAYPDDEDTHYEDCHLDHASCLAHRIRTTLTGEDTTDATT